MDPMTIVAIIVAVAFGSLIVLTILLVGGILLWLRCMTRTKYPSMQKSPLNRAIVARGGAAGASHIQQPQRMRHPTAFDVQVYMDMDHERTKGPTQLAEQVALSPEDDPRGWSDRADLARDTDDGRSTATTPNVMGDDETIRTAAREVLHPSMSSGAARLASVQTEINDLLRAHRGLDTTVSLARLESVQAEIEAVRRRHRQMREGSSEATAPGATEDDEDNDPDVNPDAQPQRQRLPDGPETSTRTSRARAIGDRRHPRKEPDPRSPSSSFRV